MKTKLLLTTMLIMSVFFVFNCSQSDNVTEPNDSKFSNPYAYIGEGHNKVCKEFLETHKELNYDVIANMSKDYLVETGHYSSQSNENSHFSIENSGLKSFISNKNLNKITDENWIDSLLTAYVNQGAITVERKNKTTELVDVILSAGGDTNVVINYCANLPATIDDTTKAQIFMTAAVYCASYRLWIGDNLGKNNQISKVQLTLLGLDAIGAAIGAVYYIGNYTLDYIDDNSTDWSWSSFGWEALVGGVGASLLGCSG